jgi:hypothetical protein
LIGDTSPIGEIVIIANELWVEGNANESRSFVDYVGRKTRGEYRCAVAMKWNHSFHASEYQIVAFTDAEDDVHDVRECNSRREVLAALRGLKQKRVAQSVADWQYSREF